METLALWLGIAGFLLVLSGIAWVFLAATNVIKEATAQQRSLTETYRATEGFDCAEAIKAFLDWLKENVPGKLLPGFGLIVAGIILFAVAFGVEISA